MKILEKLGDFLLRISRKKQQIDKANNLKKELFTNVYFAQAMEKGEIEPNPYFKLSDGTEVYLSLMGAVNYENYLIATQEIPRQYEEFGLRREKLLLMHDNCREYIRQAQVIMNNDVFDAHKILETASNMLLGLNAEVGFGSPVRQHIEQCMCFLNTKDMNPYEYDYIKKAELMERILSEGGRLLPFISALPIWTLMGLDNPYSIDSFFATHKELMERQEIKLQLAVLNQLVLRGMSEEKKNAKENMTEYMLLRQLEKIGYGN